MITHIQAAAYVQAAGLDLGLYQRRHGIGFQSGQGGGEISRRQIIDKDLPGPRYFECQGAGQQSQGRHDAGGDGKDHPWNTQLARHAHGMHRAGAAKGDHGAAPVIKAPFGGVNTKGPGHILVNNFVNTPCGPRQ